MAFKEMFIFVINLEIFKEVHLAVLVLKSYLNNAFCLEVLLEPLISCSLLELSGGFRFFILFCFYCVHYFCYS